MANNKGKNKLAYLKRLGCVFTECDMPHLKEQGHIGKLTEIRTSHGEYISFVESVKAGDSKEIVDFIYKHRLTNIMSLNRAKGKPLSKDGCNSVSIGFSEKEQSWYGWTHRGYGRFYVGYEVRKYSIMDTKKHRYPHTISTLEEAKQFAIEIAEELG